MKPRIASHLAAVLLVFAAAAPACADVILSELCDPRDNYTTDRFIEIFNTGAAPVDLTNWRVFAIANSDTSCIWTLSGTLAPGQAKVCGGPSTVTGFTVHFQNPVWATTAGYMNWNGKVGDGALLKNASQVFVDRVVATGTLFENADLVRNSSVTQANATFTPSEWTSTAVILATDASPGTHNGSTPPAGGPIISNVVTIPAVPPADTPIDVRADVVDTTGAIGSVTLTWGTTSGSQPNAIAMTLQSGGSQSFTTATPIPGYPGGATIYYRIEAVGASATTVSSLFNYALSGGGSGAPTILSVGEMSDSTLLVFFSEPVDTVTGQTPGNYSVGSLTAVAAVRDLANPSRVLITMRGLTSGDKTLVANGVADVAGNTGFGVTRDFNYVDVSIPAGYYDTAIGRFGLDLRAALHNIIDNHTVRSYDYALTAFRTTDVKPNGKVWDVYSDIPDGTPAYEYDFDDTGQGAGENNGWNREHSWPQSWFGGGSPMMSDLWLLYPTDSYVNGMRSNWPYGEVDAPTKTSTNGSKLGPCVTPGYSGTAFEPIDPFKGDLARSQFYISTRYYGEDGGFSSSAATDHATILPWAVQQFLTWSSNDPVSWKERMRNGAIYVIQGNRNPFVDHPEFVRALYDSAAVADVSGQPLAADVRLRPNTPNPFASRTSIHFDLARAGRVSMRVFDVTGRSVRTLADGDYTAGSHRIEWDGRDDGGVRLDAGLYFCRLDSGGASDTRRVVFAK